MTLLDRCRALDAGPQPTADDLRAFAAMDLTDAAIDALRRPDPSRPYGRNVLWAGERCEVMVATWTRGAPCAPHDHGGSSGAVRVLRGRARHRVWRVVDGALALLADDAVAAGGILGCGPALVHSMGDDGADEPLVTLHVYAGPIPAMTVYDVQGGRTLLVDGACGAWIPDPASVLRSVPGLVPAADL